MTQGERLDDDERKVLDTWTELDEDLGGLDGKLADATLFSRVMFARGDRPRVEHWQLPEDVDVLADIPYADDGLRGHLLDVYLPHDAVMRGGHSLPVYIDVHGGGFMYAHKEINRNFNMNLAASGFAVFSVNYRLAPGADFIDQLSDVEKAFAWIRENRKDYPVDQGDVFLTGDSAGATLALYAAAAEGSAELAHELGVEPSGLKFRGAAFVSGLFDITPYFAFDKPGEMDLSSPTFGIEAVAPVFFKRMREKHAESAALDELISRADLPSVYLNTSNDDFIQRDTLLFASISSEQGRDFEINDRHTAKGESLGHIYPVNMSWLPESREALRRIHDFSYRLL
ncbi:alpha/beta hydrolase [Bifidobacterium sp. ESL0763]|uniref:alpha/beta hydrolase n=1 Tax=Bifidobacterium sp. ESL0763 TaxID=2983227 RepID=UPI0023FA445D|nr:alpha/beta hydrolase [Bifidobacterium sp. ESL0763]MDF7663256.1 alpha/beta hydrolase [Bifidobacterium sp. ESL0763]